MIVRTRFCLRHNIVALGFDNTLFESKIKCSTPYSICGVNDVDRKVFGPVIPPGEKVKITSRV